MATWEPDEIDYDKIEDEDYKWDDHVIKDLELRFNKPFPTDNLMKYKMKNKPNVNIVEI